MKAGEYVVAIFVIGMLAIFLTTYAVIQFRRFKRIKQASKKSAT